MAKVKGTYVKVNNMYINTSASATQWMSLAVNGELKLYQMDINNVIDVINNID